jgi:hypothetical protein
MIPRTLALFFAGMVAVSAMEQAELDRAVKLIAKVASMTDYTFIRNGREHPVGDAVQLMEFKLRDQQDGLATVEEFIDRCLTRSSTSGQEYQLKDRQGAVTASAVLLKQWAAGL